MDLLISSGDFYPNRGGVTSLFDDMSRMLVERGHEVTILTRQWAGTTPLERRSGYEIVRLDYPMLFERIILDRRFLLRSPGILLSLRKILTTKTIQTVCIGLLDCSALYLLMLRPLLRFRLVLYLHGSDTRFLPKAQPTYRWILKRALAAADVIIPVSEDLAHEALAFHPGVAHKMKVIHNGIDVAGLQRAAPFKHHRPYAVFVGRLVHEKDVDTLIDAFGQISAPEIDLMIAGTGREGKRLQEKVAAAGLASRICFLGDLPREQCYSLLRGAHFAVLPSRTEGHPIVAIEARAAGTPLLGSNIPGIARVVEDGRTGLLFEQGNASELAQLIDMLCQDEAKRKQLSDGARNADHSSYDLGGALEKHLSAFGMPQ
jgi:glycosyltransferase involved in cell wall biosynthesis